MTWDRDTWFGARNVTLLREYPADDCDADGVPLSWLHCLACDGEGVRDLTDGLEPPAWVARILPENLTLEPVNGYCGVCRGHKSIRGALIAHLQDLQGIRAHNTRGWDTAKLVRAGPPRCDDCWHPMSEGTWEPRRDRIRVDVPHEFSLQVACECLPHHEPETENVHWSRCDAVCLHTGPARCQMWAGLIDPPPPRPIQFTTKYPDVATWVRYHRMTDASWRHVQLVLAGPPNDLRYDQVALLCTRCEAVRRA